MEEKAMDEKRTAISIEEYLKQRRQKKLFSECKRSFEFCTNYYEISELVSSSVLDSL